MKTLFLFIAQKPDSVDYCRGCRVASYSSDFYIESMMIRESLIVRWAEYIEKNMNLDCNEAPYEFYIFKNGFQVFYRDYSQSDAHYALDHDEADKREKEDLAEIAEICAEATLRASKKKDEKVAKEQSAKEAEVAREEFKAKQERQELYEKLKKEFQ